MINVNDRFIKDIYPLSNMQEGMLFYNLSRKNSNAYYEIFKLSIVGDVNFNILEQSFNKLIMKHDSFRTIFKYNNVKMPLQIVLKERNFKLNFQDISKLSENKQEICINNCINLYKSEKFNFEKDILIRVTLFKVDKDKYELIWNFHHLIMDGWCVGIVLKELFEFYRSIKNKLEVKLGPIYPYSIYIDWLRKQDKDKCFKYWDNYLKHYELLTTLPKFKQKVEGYKFNSLKFTVDENVNQKLAYLSKKNNVTINTLFQAVWAVILQKYNSTNDVVFGSVVSGRPSNVIGIEKMVGVFINTIPVRVKSNEDMSFIDMAKNLQLSNNESTSYQYCSLAEIQGRSKLKNNLLDHIIVFENYPLNNILKNPNLLNNIGFYINKVDVFEQSNYNFNIMVFPGDKFNVDIKYNEFIYDKNFINSIKDTIQKVLKIVTDNCYIKVKEIDIITKHEKYKILNEFNKNIPDNKNSNTIKKLFEEQVEKTPYNTAVVFENKKLTYKELNGKANFLAKLLIEKGVKKEVIVGLIVERSLEMIISIIAILKAGGAYLPIDPEYPKDRIKFMLEDSNTKILLVQKKLFMDISFKGEVINLENIDFMKCEKSNFKQLSEADNLAYVIYTSGTTGIPKGVMLNNYGISNLKKVFQKEMKVNENDKIIQFASYSFDASVWEITMALLNGAELHILSKKVINNCDDFIDYLNDNKITIATLPPAYMNIINGNKIKSLRLLITGGSQVNKEMLNSWKNVEYINAYGPTETSICSTIWHYTRKIENFKKVPIGKPINNLKVYIVDKNNCLCPIGVVGELCVSGSSIARGYLNREDLTKEKFVDNPFDIEKKMYKTGDLARWLPDGNIEYLGRVDDQVKIRGFRIEMGEIENQILKIPLITEAVVIDKNDANDEKYLCAFVVSDKNINSKLVKEELSKKLPIYMVPRCITQIEKIPLTINGKIDKRKLSDISIELGHEEEYEEPKNDIQTKMVVVFKDVLGIERVGINDNFFELGGDSIKAIRIISKLKQIGIKVDIKYLLKYQNIKQLCLCIQKKEIQQLCEQAPVVLLNKKKDRNIFVFPPYMPQISYSILYKNLSRFIKNYSFFMFNFIDNKDVIEFYTNKIIEIQKCGKIVLLGYSFGGSIAFEVANRLINKGYEVSDVILIDSNLTEKDSFENITPEFIRTKVKESLDKKYKNVIEDDNELFEEIVSTLIKFFQYTNSIVNTQIPLNINLHLIRAEDDPKNFSNVKDTRYRWRELTTKNFMEYQGRGFHNEMLEKENLIYNAKIVNCIINKIY